MGNRFSISNRWTASEIPSNAWYDAEEADTIQSTGTDLDQWNDRSGNDFHVTPPGNAPSTGVRELNGFNVIDFDSANNEYLRNNSLSSTIPVATHDIYAVQKKDNTGGDYTFVLNGSGSAQMRGNRFSDYSFEVQNDAGNLELRTDTNGDTDVHILNWRYSGSQVTLFVDGVETVTPIGQTGDVTIDAAIILGSNVFGAADFLDGFIGEFVWCPYLSDADRYRMEGYLAWKWRIEQNLPAGHLYESSPPLLSTNRLTIQTGKRLTAHRKWEPLELSQTWWDFSDPSTLWEDTSATTPATLEVRRVDDKTGNGNYITTPNASTTGETGTRTQGGQRVLDFDGLGTGSNGTRFNISDPDNLIGRECWCMVMVDNHDTNNKILGSNGGAYPSNGQMATITPAGQENMRIWSGGDNPWSADTRGPNINAGQPYVLGYLYDTNKTYSQNGTETVTSDTNDGSDWRANQIGSGSFSPTFDGIMGEIIITKRILSSAERRKMEGYLAWKYRLESYLPSDHPYKSAPPLV